MTIDLSNLPREISVAVGGRNETPLPSYAGSGNIWSVRRVAGGEVARVWVEPGDAPMVAASPSKGITEPPALVLVPERAVVLGLHPGEATWRLVLARPFGPPVPIAEHDFQVTVRAAP